MGQPLRGWDFSYVAGRITSEALPWDYAQTVSGHLKNATSLLDLGTGGGEFLSRLSPLPAHTVATEAYPPNVPIARERLEPLGVIVCDVESEGLLPFRDAQFDLVINQHDGFDPGEVFRVLRPGGYFVTQQVGGSNHVDLNRALGAVVNDEYAKWDLNAALTGLRRAGFTIQQSADSFPLVGFADVNAVVYYLRMIPWQIPDFQIATYREKLWQVHETTRAQGPLSSRAHRFFIAARRG